MATIMDGKALSKKLKEQMKERIAQMRAEGIIPKLVVVLVGNDSASEVYVRNKHKSCGEVGIESEIIHLPEETTQEELLDTVYQLNEDPTVDGILVQLPLPKQINEKIVLRAILPEKDVDGFHPINVGRLSTGQPCFAPCTPAGVMEMLKEYGVDPKGKECVVVGRSNIVGKPMGMLLLAAHGTVTICHSRTKDLGEVCRRADILVAAVGKRNIITADMVKEGAVVIDESELTNEKVHIGSRIEVDITSSTGAQSRRDFKIVGSNEADPRNGKISDESAVGKALIGAKVGDVIEVETPAGISKYHIVTISR
mgnify:CR=1 FL=1